MSTHLITGYKGQEHITSTDQASFNAAIMGNGEIVLERGEQFACQVISNNKVRILDGDALMQGRHIIIDRNTYEETTHDNGTQGMQRIDLIVFTYTKDATTGVENTVVEVIKGTPAESNPAVPEYTKGDILNNGDLKNQMPLYQIPFNGLSIGTPVQMFQTVKTLEGMKKDVFAEVENKKAEMDERFAELEENLDEKIDDAGKPLSSSADEWSMIEKYGEYSADAKTVGEEFAKVNNNLGGLRFGVDGDGNYGYYGADDSLIPFSSGTFKWVSAPNTSSSVSASVNTAWQQFSFDSTKDCIIYSNIIGSNNSGLRYHALSFYSATNKTFTPIFTHAGTHTLVNDTTVQFNVGTACVSAGVNYIITIE